MSRLIDADKLDDFKFRSASERMDLSTDYMAGWNEAIDYIQVNAPTVEAIPISFIEEMKQKFGNQIDEYGGIAEHEEWVDNIVVRLNALDQLLNEWAERKEE